MEVDGADGLERTAYFDSTDPPSRVKYLTPAGVAATMAASLLVCAIAARPDGYFGSKGRPRFSSPRPSRLRTVTFGNGCAAVSPTSPRGVKDEAVEVALDQEDAISDVMQIESRWTPSEKAVFDEAMKTWDPHVVEITSRVEGPGLQPSWEWVPLSKSMSTTALLGVDLLLGDLGASTSASNSTKSERSGKAAKPKGRAAKPKGRHESLIDFWSRRAGEWARIEESQPESREEPLAPDASLAEIAAKFDLTEKQFVYALNGDLRFLHRWRALVPSRDPSPPPSDLPVQESVMDPLPEVASPATRVAPNLLTDPGVPGRDQQLFRRCGCATCQACSASCPCTENSSDVAPMACARNDIPPRALWADFRKLEPSGRSPPHLQKPAAGWPPFADSFPVWEVFKDPADAEQRVAAWELGVTEDAKALRGQQSGLPGARPRHRPRTRSTFREVLVFTEQDFLPFVPGRRIDVSSYTDARFVPDEDIVVATESSINAAQLLKDMGGAAFPDQELVHALNFGTDAKAKTPWCLVFSPMNSSAAEQLDVVGKTVDKGLDPGGLRKTGHEPGPDDRWLEESTHFQSIPGIHTPYGIAYKKHSMDPATGQRKPRLTTDHSGPRDQTASGRPVAQNANVDLKQDHPATTLITASNIRKAIDVLSSVGRAARTAGMTEDEAKHLQVFMAYQS